MVQWSLKSPGKVFFLFYQIRDDVLKSKEDMDIANDKTFDFVKHQTKTQRIWPGPYKLD